MSTRPSFSFPDTRRDKMTSTRRVYILGMNVACPDCGMYLLAEPTEQYTRLKVTHHPVKHCSSELNGKQFWFEWPTFEIAPESIIE